MSLPTAVASPTGIAAVSAAGSAERPIVRRAAPGGLSVVVPVYRSERSLPLLVSRLAEVLPELTVDFEVVLVDDGSPDASWSVVQALTAEHPWVRGVRFMRNYGQHNALLCGIRAARYATIVTMDDDLQHPPEEIPRLLARLDEGYDVVYGAPQALQHGLLRNFASRVTKLVLQNAMGVDSASNVSAFRGFRRELREGFAAYQNAFVSLDVLLTWSTTRFAVVPVRHEERRIGESNYTVAKLVRHALNMMTGFSTLPLRLASIVGFAFTLFGIAVLLYAVGRYLVGGSMPGFPFLASIIAIFSGAQLFALGIIGEYLARMHTRMQERPTYVIRGTAWPTGDEAPHPGDGAERRPA